MLKTNFNLFAAQTKLSDLPVACTKTLAQKKEKFVFNFKDGKVNCEPEYTR